jgi:N-acetylmuramoyl-L-alanine amidase
MLRWTRRTPPYRSTMQIPSGRGRHRQPGCVTRRDVLRYAAAGPLLLGLPAVASPLTAPVAAAASSIAGTIVFLDPGHNGANDGSINRQVPTGRGGTKECQTTGTTTDAGYPEHTFNWDVVLRIRAELSQLGVRTALSRGNDNALGPCVDQRAAMANALRPNAIVSIHADGGPPGGRGFHVNYSAPPLNEAQAGPSVQLAKTMRDQLVAAGFTPSTYRGTDGLYGRSDLAGLNLAQFPSVLIELGNMKNRDDVALIVSEQGRAKYAAAVASGLNAYLSQRA